MTGISRTSTPPDSWTSRDERSLDELLDDENGNPIQNRISSKMRVVGVAPNRIFIPDDLSSIAHDTTLGGGSGMSSSYRTPEKKRKNNNGSVPFGNDDETVPETPPKVIHSPASKVVQRSYRQRSVLFRRLMVGAACMGIILLVAIAALSYTFYGMNQDEDSTGANTGNLENNGGEDVNKAPPSGAPDSAPSGAASPIAVEWVEASIMVHSSNFYEGSSSSLAADPSSIPYKVLEWLGNDPYFASYTGEKVVQRYALGVVYLSLLNNDAIATARQENNNVWLSSTDECTWPTSRDSASLCNENGVIQSLYLEDWNLSGSLVPEIGLLKGLKMIFLTSNQIRGEIPSTMGLLTSLERLNLPRNQMNGTLPTELGMLGKLGVLGLGNNLFSGPIPSEIGRLTSLTSLLLQNNALSGVIPNQLGNLARLTNIQLESNQLQGHIPVALGNSSVLQDLSLNDNALTGQVPSELCAIESLNSLTVDCEAVVCSCCQDCGVISSNITTSTMSPTEQSSQGATDSPSAPTSMSSTSLTTLDDEESSNSTTIPPTQCHQVESIRECFERDEAIELTIVNCDVGDGDVLAFYRLSDVEDSSFLKNPIFWEPTCGETTCTGTITEDSLTFEGFRSQKMDDMPWPLQREEYVLMLLRFFGGGSMRVMAESPPFSVDNRC